jgi:hypothetical protein
LKGSRTDQGPWDRRLGTLALLQGAHVLLAVLILPQLPARDGYLDRYQILHESTGRPYRDFAVEYPPVLILMVDALASDTESVTARHLVLMSLAADAVLVLVLLRDRGRESANRYLALTLPLVPFFVATLDIVSVMLCVSGVVLCRRDRERAGGAIIALAILTKVWPIVLVPGLLVTGRRRALRWCIGATAAGVAAWIAWGGVSGPWQVISERGATGWEIESMIGSILWAFGGHVTYVHDSARTGLAPFWSAPVLVVVLFAALAAVWKRSMTRPSEAWGSASLAAVSSLLAASSVLSYPYATWITPWGATADPDGPWFRLSLSITLSTALFMLALSQGTHPLFIWTTLLVRNALVLAVVVRYLVPTTTTQARTNTAPSASS